MKKTVGFACALLLWAATALAQPATSTISGTLFLPDGSTAAANTVITFDSQKTQTVGGETVQRQIVATETDANGAITPISLAQGLVVQVQIGNAASTTAIVPFSGSTTLEDFLTTTDIGNPTNLNSVAAPTGAYDFNAQTLQNVLIDSDEIDGIVNPIGKGVTCDGSTDDRSSLSSADPGTNGILRFPPNQGTCVIGSNITISGALYVGPGTQLQPGNGVTITVNNLIEPGPWQVFDASQGGSVTFAVGGTLYVRPEWWGAVVDDSADDATAIQDAMDALPSNSNLQGSSGVLKLSDGQYDTASSVRPPSGILIEGEGVSTLIKGAVSGNPVLDLTNRIRNTLRDFRIEGDSSTVPSVGLLLARDSTGNSAGLHRIERVRIRGNFTAAAFYNYGSEENTVISCQFRIDGGGGDSAATVTARNVDSVTSPHATIATGSQSTNGHVFHDSEFRWFTAAADSGLKLEGPSDVSINGSFFTTSATNAQGEGIRLVSSGGKGAINLSVRDSLFHSTMDFNLSAEENADVDGLVFVGNRYGSVNTGNIRLSGADLGGNYCHVMTDTFEILQSGGGVQGNVLADGCLFQVETKFEAVNQVHGLLMIPSGATLTFSTPASADVAILFSDLGIMGLGGGGREPIVGQGLTTTTLRATATATLDGNATIGDGSGDSHTVNGTFTLADILRVPRVESGSPSAPVTCDDDAVGVVTYVDDTNDGAVAELCFCTDTDDGSTFDWRSVDDFSASCPFF